jgi:hypothetical protein
MLKIELSPITLVVDSGRRDARPPRQARRLTLPRQKRACNRAKLS